MNVKRYGELKTNKWTILKNLIHGADVVVEVLDARDVNETRLPIAERFTGSKRLLMVANKMDLLPKNQPMESGGLGRTALPKFKLPNRGITISAKEAKEADRIRLIRAILERTEKRPVHALFVGYPNVGKSSLINLLARRQAAKVSPVAGTTKDIQWVKISDELLVSDYRGLYPNREAEKDLVRKGAIKFGGEQEKYAYLFAEKVLGSKVLRNWLERRYDVDLAEAKDCEDVLTIIAKRRGWYLKGGEPNMGEAARSLLRAMAEAPEI